MEKFRITALETLNIPAGNDVALLVKLVKGFEQGSENALDTVPEPWPLDVSDDVAVSVVSERGVVTAVPFTTGEGGRLLFTLRAADVRVGLKYGIDVKGTLNDVAWHAYGKSLVSVMAATERGPQQVTAQGDPYEITLVVGYSHDIVPRSLRDLAEDPDHRTVTDAEKERWNNPPQPDISQFAEQISEQIRQLDVLPMQLVTWQELKQLRDRGKLIPGRQYRITDYVATTTQENTASAGRPFDIIVTADSPTKLSEWARACKHDDTIFCDDCGYCDSCDTCDSCGYCDSCADGGDPFWNSRLESWLLLYSLDNDASRFAWADTENGKGVVYWMRDEWGNEMPFDFKGILFWHVNPSYNLVGGSTSYHYYYYYYYAFSTQRGGNILRQDEEIYDASLDGIARRNIVRAWYDGGVQKLNNIIFFVSDDFCTSHDLPFGEILDNFFDYNCHDLIASKVIFAENGYEALCFEAKDILVNRDYSGGIVASGGRYGFPADKDTTYTLSKSGTDIVLTGSDGKTSKVADANTTYTLMSQAEANTGTATTARSLSAKVLKAAILKHTEDNAKKSELPLMTILSASSEVTIAADGRKALQIDIPNIPNGYVFGAYRGISLAGTSSDSEGFKSVVIQSFGSAGGGTKTNILLKNISQVQVSLTVSADVFFFKSN